MKKGFKVFISYYEKKKEEDAELSLEIVLMLTSVLQKQVNLLNEKLLTFMNAKENDSQNITQTLNAIGYYIDGIKHTISCLAAGVNLSIKSIEEFIGDLLLHERTVENILNNFGNN